MSYVAFQYAEALFGLALEEKKVEIVQSDLKDLNSAIDTEIYNFLIHPKITKNAKKEIISSVLSNDLIKNFVYVLIDNLRIELLDDIYLEFTKIVDNQNKVMKVVAYSNKLLSKSQTTQLIANLEKKHNRKIELNNVVDESIVGGMRIEFEGKVLDDTINNYLHNLKANLTK
jgi:F-type H+-transporting ATPase subunit delta